MTRSQQEIKQGEHEWSNKLDSILASGTCRDYWLAYREYLLWCIETSNGYLSPMRRKLLFAVTKTIGELK